MNNFQDVFKKTISFTKARNNLGKLIERLPKEGYMIVTKRLSPAFVMVEPYYFEELERLRFEEKRREKIGTMLRSFRKAFSSYLKKRGLDETKLSDKEVMELIKNDLKTTRSSRQ